MWDLAHATYIGAWALSLIFMYGYGHRRGRMFGLCEMIGAFIAQASNVGNGKAELELRKQLDRLKGNEG